jgi:hypothetical protein
MRQGLRHFVICRGGHGGQDDLLILRLDLDSGFDLWSGRLEGGRNRLIVGHRYR